MHNPKGGVKKVIYNGSTKKRTLFDEDESFNQSWNFKNQQTGVKQGQQFNLDDVWSIKKNVGVNKAPIANVGGDSFWERKAGKGYYSRHGGISDENSTADTQGVSGGFYQPGNTTNYSYSYTDPSGKQQAASNGSSSSTPWDNTSPASMNNGRNAANGFNGYTPKMGPSPANIAHSHSRHGGPVSSRYQGPVASKQPRRF